MKNISDSLDELRDLIKNLDKKLDKIIERNSPPEDVVELFKKIKEENVVKWGYYSHQRSVLRRGLYI